MAIQVGDSLRGGSQVQPPEMPQAPYVSVILTERVALETRRQERGTQDFVRLSDRRSKPEQVG